MNKSLTLELPSLDELYQQWREDRQQRRSMPVRRCIGLAAIFRDVDECECVDDMVLYPNDAITWVCMRDIPARYSTTGWPQTLVMTAKAKLRYGMPHIDFAENVRHSIDFSKIPARRQYTNALNPDEQRDLFGVLNRASMLMTKAQLRWSRPKTTRMPRAYFMDDGTASSAAEILWDFSATEPYTVTDLNAAIFPVLPINTSVNVLIQWGAVGIRTVDALTRPLQQLHKANVITTQAA